MAEVLDLEYFRDRRPARAVVGGAELAPQYFCNRCGSHEFALFTNGTVLCAHCSLPLRNVSVVKNSQGATP